MGYYGLAPDSTKSERVLLSNIFKAAHSRGTGGTGIFGLRLQRHSFEFFMQKLHILVPDCLNDQDRIKEVFGQTLFVHLTRQNKLEQAISYVKASQTGLWHKAPNGQELQRCGEPQDPIYDAEAIQHHMTELAAMDRAWISWFAQERISPLHINYEDLSKDPIAVTERLLQKLGLARGLTIGLELPVAKLANTTNIQWALRFRNDKCS